jgi:juvenile hormone diol kinase
MLSEIMKKKLTHHFNFQDHNKDTFVEQSDWEQCAKNLAKERGWKPGSEEYKDILKKHIEFWNTFWKPADQDGDGKVSLEEYLQLAGEQRNKAGFSLSSITELFGTVFDAIDFDNDKKIMLADYKKYFKAWGGDENMAEPAFSNIDLSSDGIISRMIFIQCAANFFASDEKEEFGNLMFGPYETIVEN